MNKLSLISLAAVAACSGAPVIQQSAPIAPKADPKTEKMLSEALETAQLSIHDKCIGLLSNGRTFSRVDEYMNKSGREKAVTTLEVVGVTQTSQNGNNQEECKCTYRIDVPTGLFEHESCRSSSYSKVYIGDAAIDRLASTSISHGLESNEKSITRLSTDAEDVRTEIPADSSGCKVNQDSSYDPAKLSSCKKFTDKASQLTHDLKEAICRNLRRKNAGKNIPPLCSRGEAYAPAPRTSNNR